MVMALMSVSSDVNAAAPAKAKKSSMLGDMINKAKQMGNGAAAGMSNAASGAAAKLKSMRK